MVKAFKRENPYQDYDEVTIINIDNGAFSQYLQDKQIGFIFDIWNTNYKEMGYKSVDECLKTLKQRNILGKEIDYEQQRQSEKIGYINLGIERIKRHNRINTLDFDDVIKKLADYGLGYCDAQNQIIATYENSL